jgi:hypothetical protein
MRQLRSAAEVDGTALGAAYAVKAGGGGGDDHGNHGGGGKSGGGGGGGKGKRSGGGGGAGGHVMSADGRLLARSKSEVGPCTTCIQLS